MARLTVLFVVSECVPFAKTGGLADVAGALPSALAARGHDVRVLMPRYRCTKRQPATRLLDGFGVRVGSEERWCSVLEGKLPGDVPVYLLEHDVLYDRDGLYGDAHGSFGDNALRYSLLCHAALALPGALGFSPDVMHVHDWQGGLVPVLLRARGERTASILTIHNLGYQGVFGLDVSGALGVSEGALRGFDVEHFGTANLLKGGIRNATAISTVSPRYAAEIQTVDGGAGLDGVLRSRREALVGILNGIDTRTWDPARDPHIAANYDVAQLGGKAVCKKALQAELGLDERSDVPLLGIVSRFAPQKGIDLLAEALPVLLAQDLQLAMLGSGEAWAHAHFGKVSREVKSVQASFGYDEGLAHRIEAGADLFLMPSRYEPCGLNQLYSQRYGTPPIVRHVGGLVDTVRDGVDGFAFRELSARAFAEATQRAVRVYRNDPESFRAIQRAGMQKRLGWDQAAIGYEALYRMALSRLSG